MIPSRFIVVGCDNTRAIDRLPDGEVLVVPLPHERIPESLGRAKVLAAKSLDDALIQLRHRFSEHGDIITLASTKVIGPPDEAQPRKNPGQIDPGDERRRWTDAITARLGELFDDLGNCPLDSWRGARNAIANGVAIATCPTSSALHNAHAEEPAICIASGPSASDHLEAVRALAGKVRIFAADSILSGLAARDIHADYVCMVEREPVLRDLVAPFAGRCGRLIAPAVADPECLAPFGDRIVLWGGSDDLYRWIDPAILRSSSGRSAGTLTVAAALLAGCNPIYLVGHDLCYRSGAPHAREAHPIAHIAAATADGQANSANYHDLRMSVMGNAGLPLETKGIWNLFRMDIEALRSIYPDRIAINVQRDHHGAAIAGIPVGDLPQSPPRLQPAALRPEYRPPNNPRWRVRSILEDLQAIESACDRQESALAEDRSELAANRAAEHLAVSQMVSEKNKYLFHYVFRSLYNALMLRLHIRRSSDPGLNREAQKSALLTLIASLRGMCAVMRRDLASC